jgi:hypothetical protein
MVREPIKSVIRKREVYTNSRVTHYGSTPVRASQNISILKSLHVATSAARVTLSQLGMIANTGSQRTGAELRFPPVKSSQTGLPAELSSDRQLRSLHRCSRATGADLSHQTTMGKKQRKYSGDKLRAVCSMQLQG